MEPAAMNDGGMPAASSRLKQAKAAASAQFSATAVPGVQACPAPVVTKRIVRKGIGALVTLCPELFAPHENPADKSLFTIQKQPAFETGHLLADGRSKAVIPVCLIKLPPDQTLDDQTTLSLADAGWHGGEGTVELALSNPQAGILTYKGRQGAALTIPVADFPTGRSGLALTSTDAVTFTAARIVAEATLSITLRGIVSQEYYPSFYVPKRPAFKPYRHEVIVGTRVITVGAKGYDVLKAQWYLRRFHFLAHDMRKINRAGTDCEWDHVADIGTTGEFTTPQSTAAKEFQIVSLSSYRNRALQNAPITFTAAASATVTAEAACEMAVWDDARFTVEPYNGIADLIYNGPNGEVHAGARIAYGVLHDDAKPVGYLEILDPIGNSNVVLPTTRFSVAAEIRSGIRLHDRTNLIWSLHDADPLRKLASPYCHPELVARVRATVAAVRRKQGKDYGVMTGFDIRVQSGYRDNVEQAAIYEKGRITPGEPCRHSDVQNGPAVPHPVGTCKIHPLGKTVTNAKAGGSFHNFGMAVDIAFNTKTGDYMEENTKPKPALAIRAVGLEAEANRLQWGDRWPGKFQDTDHLQVAKDMAPTNADKNTLATAPGNTLQKLTAAWSNIVLQN